MLIIETCSGCRFSMSSEVGTGSIPSQLELEERAKWSKHIVFVITCIGYAVGLGNVWRFPYLCYSNGGGAFLIPYFTCLFLMGIPIFFLEVMVGQFAGVSTVTLWEINPLFKGFGWSMVLVAGHVCIYYNVVIAVAAYFLFASFNTVLPWSTCENEWNSCYCRPDTMDVSLINSAVWYNQTTLPCRSVTVDEKSRVSPSHEFYYNKVLDMTSGMDELGGLKWDLTLCNLFIWILVFLIIIRGVKSIGKVVYISALLPYFLMAALLIKGVTLEGASKGAAYYMQFDLDSIWKPQVWRSAASQILFSLSACMGSLMALSSYNKFHENCVRDSFTIPFINCATSIFAGFVVFTILGHMSEITGVEIEDAATSGPGLIFVVYPIALSGMPLAQMWSCGFFLMVVLLGLGSQFPNVETVVTAFQDEVPWLRIPKYNITFRFLICTLGFILGLPQTTRGGMYVLNLFDRFVEFPLLFVGLIETVAIIQIYGATRFTEDFMLMLGYSSFNILVYTYYLKWCLIVVTPALLLWIITNNMVDYKPISIDDAYPDWAEAIGWIIVSCDMIWTPLWFVSLYCYRGGFKLLRELSEPTPKWGPSDPDNRTIERYMPLPISEDQEDPNALPEEGSAIQSEVPDSPPSLTQTRV